MTHKHPPGAATIEVSCKRCKGRFTARVADRARGWGKFCSKSCKAIKQEARTGQYGRLIGKPSHVTAARFREDQREYGGTPQYDGRGDYIGFTMNGAELAGGGYGDSDPYDGLPVGHGKE